MPNQKRPSITSPCVADRYHSQGERIAEISLGDGRGFLLSITASGIINLYRPTGTMKIGVGGTCGGTLVLSDDEACGGVK